MLSENPALQNESGGAPCDSIRISLPSPWTASVRGNRRREGRFASSGLALVRRLDSSGESLSAEVVDVSKHGMQLFLDTRIEPGTIVHVFLEEMFVVAEVRYAKSWGAGYQHGILIKHSSSLLPRSVR